ncbi:MAG: PorT family protein [Dysgonamonadaceae bacterium]|jgi:hypothetical protein|nr:PorT family protein [Dysgonamonadaceae bacterium]
MKKIILLTTGLLCCLLLFGQSRHEFSIYGGFGSSGLKYEINEGDRSNVTGGTYGLGYTLFFNEHFGFATGIGWSTYKSKAEIYDTDCIIPDLDDGDDIYNIYELQTKINWYTEKQRLKVFNIPLLIQYQSKGKTKFYLQTGIKLAFPSSAGFESENYSLTNARYYPDLDNPPITEPTFEGLGNFEDRSSKGDLDFKTATIYNLEMGLKWSLGGSTALYTGIYLDSGLNNIHNESQQFFIKPNKEDPENFSNYSILEAQSEPGKSFVEKVKPFAIGLNFRLSFGTGKF